jgi:hypothetical protein
MQSNVNIIHWSITDHSANVACVRTGTVLPHTGESWAHMVRFLKQTGPTEFLTAYRVNAQGGTVDYNDIDFETEDSADAELWFLDK